LAIITMQMTPINNCNHRFVGANAPTSRLTEATASSQSNFFTPRHNSCAGAGEMKHL
jgi:hypothetical protein